MIHLTIGDDDVAVVALDNPSRMNALDEQALRDLDSAYARAEAAGVRALVLRGEDARSAQGGTSLASIRGRTTSARTSTVSSVHSCSGCRRSRADLRRRARRVPRRGPRPPDRHRCRLRRRDREDRVPVRRAGATLDSGGHALFVERLGAHKTLDLIYTGRLMSGSEAVQSGLFSQVLPDAEVTAATLAAARRAATGATAAFRASKRLVAQLRDERVGLWDAMVAENAAQAALGGTDDYREGFAAFQEKRPPSFTGR